MNAGPVPHGGAGPESSIDEAVAGFAPGCSRSRLGTGATLKCTELFVSGVSVGVATGVPSAVGSGCCLRRELCSACRLEARPGLGPARALHTGGAWSVMNGQAAAPPALSTLVARGLW